MKPRIVTDLIYFDEDAARTEVLHETEHLFSQVICLQEAQGIGPMRDAASEGLVVVLSGEVAAQVGRDRARMRQWASVTVPAGDESDASQRVRGAVGRAARPRAAAELAAAPARGR